MNALDPTRYEKLRADPALGPRIEIRALCFEDGTMQIEGPFGDKELFLRLVDQLRDAVQSRAFSRGWLEVPGRLTDARPRSEGYS
jgi:hypothetical protein